MAPRLAPASVIALLACGGPAGPETARIEGLWDYTEVLEDRLRGLTCSDTGTYRLRQSGAAFEGVYFQRGVCLGTGGGFFNTDSGRVSSGSIVGHTLRFAATPMCQYEGRFNGALPSDVAGKGFCTLTINGTLFSFEGTWRATRQP
jgi:hypothetical protein